MTKYMSFVDLRWSLWSCGCLTDRWMDSFINPAHVYVLCPLKMQQTLREEWELSKTYI